MTSSLRPEDPRSLGRYELIGRLGEGGMGAVFLGRDPVGGLVAVKVIKAEYAREENFRARFRSEVNRAREVPAFCTAEVLDADPDHETPYLVVEYVDGPTLAEVIREQGPLRGGSLHSVAVGVASALVAIHSAGIVHRDLKPANVLFALGSPKVIDFGIAKAVEATSHHTATQEMVGTLAYMSPERFTPDADQQLSPAADVFAWGAVVAYAATGRNPFAGDSPAATAGRILTQPPQLDGLPAGLAGIVGRALDKDPAQRPTAQDLLLELTAGPGRDTPIPADVHRAAEAARGLRRPRGRWQLAAAAVVLLAAGGAWAGAQLPRSTPSAAAEPSASPVIALPAVRQSAKELFDPLTADGLWSASGDAANGCTPADGLIVRATAFTQCEYGPRQVFEGDTHITVRAEMSVRSCVMIWFRLSADGDNGYYASVCADDVAVLFLNDGALDYSDERNVVAGSMKMLKIEDNGPHVIGVDVVKSTAKVSVDGKTVLTSDLSRGKAAGARHKSGQVTFGAAVGGNGPKVTVVLRDAHVTAA
ncbi:serine/threonine-protein kinase [Actinoplanes awajinensis]|uniref:serine/threonine-protein kinase n=1 Tax=Actinoplanes awajinensis TaxID=135946 RepID=UPI000A047D93|nr:serine/threonine-protein kinase [Actinoplanes awajinensis]